MQHVSSQGFNELASEPMYHYLLGMNKVYCQSMSLRAAVKKYGGYVRKVMNGLLLYVIGLQKILLAHIAPIKKFAQITTCKLSSLD